MSLDVEQVTCDAPNAPVLCPPDEDPLLSALSYSTTSRVTRAPQPESDSKSGAESPDAFENGMENSQTLKPKPVPHVPWHCQVIISRPPVPEPPAPKGKEKGKPIPVAEPEYLIRSNTIAGYWELNRRFLRTLSSSVGATPARPAFDDPTGKAAIHASAQISADSLIGEGTKIGERSSIKKSIIGRHCVIGKGAKLSGCILWDFVTVDEK